MNPFTNSSFRFAPSLTMLSLAAALLWPAAPVMRAQNAPAKIDLSKIKTNVDDVVVPVPSEIFNVLDKLGHPNWAGQVRVDNSKTPPSRPHQSLLFGTVIADGFLAVQAKDADKVKKIGRRVLELAQALGVKESVIAHTQSIIDAADRSDWTVVRTELDKTQFEVKDAMNKLQNKDESELVSMGGWLRGTEALTDLVRKDYNTDRAELLHQPDLLQTFDRQLNNMKQRTRTNTLITKLQAGLSEIRPLVADSGADVKRETVERINGIAGNLITSIYATP